MSKILKVYYILDGLLLLVATSWIADRWIYDVRLFGVKLWGYGLVIGFIFVPLGFIKIFLSKKSLSSEDFSGYRRFIYVSNFFLLIWLGFSSMFMSAILSVLFRGMQ